MIHWAPILDAAGFWGLVLVLVIAAAIDLVIINAKNKTNLNENNQRND